MDYRLPSRRCRSYFWHCPLACCVTWYKSLNTSPFPWRQDSCWNIHHCLQCHSQSLATGLRTGQSCVTCQKNQAVSYSFFLIWLHCLGWIHQRARSRWCDFSLYPMQKKKKEEKTHLKTYKTSSKCSGKVLFQFWEALRLNLFGPPGNIYIHTYIYIYIYIYI